MKNQEARNLEALTGTIRIPDISELVEASALLAACPDLAHRYPEEEVAIAEYCYYSTQTYIFEVVGFQILGEMVCGLRRFEFVHELAAQAREEAAHAETYRRVVNDLPLQLLQPPFEVHATPFYDAFVKGGGIEEKVVASYFVLESIAMGIFMARQRCYRTSQLARMDHLMMADEAAHQSIGVRIVAELIRDGRITIKDVKEIVRAAATKVDELLVPRVLFERFDVQGEARDCKRVQGAGFLAVQHATSQKAILNSLRALHRAISERVSSGSHEEQSDARAA